MQSSRTGALRWSSGHLDPTGGFRVVLRNQGSGQRGRRKAGVAESLGRSFSPVAGLRRIPAAAQAEVEGKGLGVRLGVEVELRRGLAGVELQRSGMATTA